jgi:hypothetical protein
MKALVSPPSRPAGLRVELSGGRDEAAHVDPRVAGEETASLVLHDHCAGCGDPPGDRAGSPSRHAGERRRARPRLAEFDRMVAAGVEAAPVAYRPLALLPHHGRAAPRVDRAGAVTHLPALGILRAHPRRSGEKGRRRRSRARRAKT